MLKVEKTKTIVSIGGKEYTICGSESAEYIHRVALKVNGKLSEIKQANPELNNMQLAMLTSINLADDYVKAIDDAEFLRREVEQLKTEVELLKRGKNSVNALRTGARPGAPNNY